MKGGGGGAEGEDVFVRLIQSNVVPGSMHMHTQVNRTAPINTHSAYYLTFVEEKEQPLYSLN